MAKCIVTFTDCAGGNVTMEIAFDPPAERDEDLTPAQSMACQLALRLHRETEECDDAN